ncbi:MAG: GNAT family N-acetyltransferase [Breznakia sp.]
MLLKIDDITCAYAILEETFPKGELASKQALEAFCEAKKMTLYGYYEKSALRAVLSLWEFENTVFIENFAVEKSFRGSGIGSRMLQEIVHRYKTKTIVLEVETAYDTISQKRVNFYKKNGFVLNDYSFQQPQICNDLNPFPLSFMLYNQQMDKAGFEAMKTYIFSKVYAQYAQHQRLHVANENTQVKGEKA